MACSLLGPSTVYELEGEDLGNDRLFAPVAEDGSSVASASAVSAPKQWEAPAASGVLSSGTTPLRAVSGIPFLLASPANRTVSH